MAETQTAAPAVVETPVPLSEQEITETYLEARAEGKVEDLPIPPPTIPEGVPEPPKLVDETPAPPEVVAIQETDTYIEGRKERKDVKRKSRGGVQSRIDKLTKEKAEAEEKAAQLEAEKAHAPIPPGTVKDEEKPAEVVAPVVQQTSTTEPKPRPRMNEFDDADAYHAAMAMWALEETNRTKPQVAAPVQLEQPKAPDYMQVRKEEFDKFMERGKQFVATHPDFNTTLEAAHVRGLTISEQARTAITRLAVPEVAYWLAKPENDLAARRLMQMDDLQQVVEVGRIAERLAVSPADFVSQAPAPGLRLTGSNVRTELPLNQVTDTDEYIRRRRQERRIGRR